MDMNQYLEIFIDESKEHLQNLNECLLVLEKNPDEKNTINEIFRVAHTLKGMSGTMGYSKMSTLTHHMEDVLDSLRNDKTKVNDIIIDVLFKCLDALELYVNNIVNSGNEGEETFDDIIASLSSVLNPDSEQAQEKPKEKHDKPSKDSSSVDDNSLKLEVNEYDKNVISKALDTNLNVFEISVYLSNSCLLKAARAFIIFQILDKYSEVIKSNPSVEDIEDERFEYEFTVIIITKEGKDKLLKELNSVAEVEKINLIEYTKDLVANNKASKNTEQSPQQPQKKSNTTSQTVRKNKNAGKTVRVDINRLDALMNLVSELIIIKTGLDDNELAEKNAAMSQSLEYLERVTTNLHDAVMKVRMVPVEMVFNRFPRMIRDVSKELNKEIDLIMSGTETELDRTVIDEIGDPLIHILRNSADHGIETADKRIKAGKPQKGTINLRAYQDGNNVVIEVEDDGNGINVEKVRNKIIEKELLDQELAEKLTDKEVIDYLFKPSFSTADKITDISGRGVGLDVVKTKIEALGGVVEVETKKGVGSRFIIRLPLTLAIIQALLVMINQEKYAIPLSSINEIISINQDDIKYVQKKEVIVRRDTVIPLVWLENVLEVPSDEEAPEKKNLTVVIVRKGNKLSGFIVDKLIGQQEIVIKSLGKLLSGIKCIAGATILGDGNVALIVDVNSLI